MSLGEKIVIYLLSCIFSMCVIFLSLIKILKSGKTYFVVKERDTPPACLTDPSFEHSYITLKDIKIHYVEAGDKTKPLMLFVHGFPEFWYSWRHQIKEFKKEYWVVAIDLRGYGNSDKPMIKSMYKMENFVTDVRDVITGLGRTSTILVAHDWGGAIAWAFAHKYPEMVEKLVIMNCPHPVAFHKHIRSSFKQLFMSWYMFFFQAPFLPESYLRCNDLEIFDKIFHDTIFQFTPEDIEAYKYTFSKKGAFTPPVNYYRNLFSLANDQDQRFKLKLQCPVLIIWGAKDMALDSRMADLSTAFVENCKLKMIPTASHWVQLDSPNAVNEHMWDFLIGKN